MIEIVCVLKSGGEYTLDHVFRLSNMISRNVTIPYQFFCLSDEMGSLVIGLKHNWPGWWSKIEMFRTGLFDCERIVYLDLDTVIVANIDPLLELDVPFAALGAWRPNSPTHIYGSGILIWRNNGEYSFLYDEFDPKKIARYRRGDQQYISMKMIEHKKRITALQQAIPGIYSYKKNCQQGLPGDARTICFHGRPRPWQVDISWVRENWR